MAIEIRPITLKAANDYVATHHRHNGKTSGHKWSVAVYDGETLCGVAIAGQPIARKLDNGLTIEIRRVCTDGTPNACSMLYGACCRAARAMGYKRVVTYTLVSELFRSSRITIREKNIKHPNKAKRHYFDRRTKHETSHDRSARKGDETESAEVGETEKGGGEEEMSRCKWEQDEVCVNDDCPLCADFCPVTDTPGVCRFEEREAEE